MCKPVDRPIWALKRWHWCVHYQGMVRRVRCGAGVPFEDVGVAAAIWGRAAETHYPCCLEWDGSDSCPKRQVGGETPKTGENGSISEYQRA